MMRSSLCAAFLLLAPLYAAERVDHATTPCGEERPAKRSVGRKALGLPGAFEKRFSDLALSISSIGVPQARCEVDATPRQKVSNALPEKPDECTLDLLCDRDQGFVEHSPRPF